MSTTNTDTTFVYPPNAKEHIKQSSPLAATGWVASGFYYDPRTGLVQRNPVKEDEVKP
jgi:hypothetical protein